MKLVGIDYSMTSPSIAVYDGDIMKYYYLTNKKKLVGEFLHGQVIGTEYPLWKTPEERFCGICQWATDIIKDSDTIRIEGYAFGAKGSALFQIGENTGMLKQMIWFLRIPFDTIAPTQVKKHATGSGRAKKEDMYDAFQKETGIDLCSILSMNNKDDNPVSDIVDAHFICSTLIASV